MTQSSDQRSAWEIAIEQCANYRKYLDGLSLEPDQKTKAYLIDKSSIQQILNQNGGRLDAIRIYVGHEIIKEQPVVRLHLVGCTRDGDQFNDWDIPSGKEALESQTILGSTRPCPTQCSSPNSLNS